MPETVVEGKTLGGGGDGIHQTTAAWVEADVQEKQTTVDDYDDAILIKMGKQPKMKRRYNFWTRESASFPQVITSLQM